MGDSSTAAAEQSTETVELTLGLDGGEPARVMAMLSDRGKSLRSLRIHSVGLDAAPVLHALAGGVCPILDLLELGVDLSQQPDHLIGVLQMLITRLSSLRQLVLLFDPLPPPPHLLAVALSVPSLEHITFGSRGRDLWVVEAQAVANLLTGGAVRSDYRDLVLVQPNQTRCSRAGRIEGSEPWPVAIQQTIKVTALLAETRVSVVRDDPSPCAWMACELAN